MRITPADIVLAGLLLLCSLPAQAALCPSDRIDGTAKVKSVTDGDTVRFVDGRKARLIGINTPELGYGKQPHQPLALEAKKALSQLLAAHHQVQLRFGHTKKDRYGRHLLHLFLTDGSSVTARLLQSGLGTHIVIPNNTWNSDCYHQVEQQARKRNAGLWSSNRNPITNSRLITRDSEGFKIIRGIITRIRKVKGLDILHMGDNLELVIRPEEQSYFPADFIDNLINREVEVRGWLYHYRGRPNMRIRHPYSIHVTHESTLK